MLRWIFAIIILLQIGLVAVYGAETKITIDSLTIVGDHLTLCYHIDNLLDDRMLEGLQRGLTSEILHHVQLWRSKNLVSRIEAEKYYSIKVFYDTWEGKFAIATEFENRLTSNMATLQRICSVIENLPLAATSAVDENTKYYITIQTTFQPISDESYAALRKWVSGKSQAKETEKMPVKRGRIFGMLVDLMGFGDKVISFKSNDFIVQYPLHVEFLK
jgi:hypothetical protein